MSAGSETRRQTPLALKLAERIRREGPMTVAAYMEAALQDPEHGFYRCRTGIGADGDFITAPEISQVFGELIGLWTAVVWQGLGGPARCHLIELGPGRGTMMADMLRATRGIAGFGAALSVHLVESSATLGAMQRQTLQGVLSPVTWWPSVADLATGIRADAAPAIVIANEFLDAMPVMQYVVGEHGVMARGVGLDADGALTFTTLPWGGGVTLPAGGNAGDIFERQDVSVLDDIGAVARGRAFAGLLIDYGHQASGYGDTLQAVRRHRAEHPLASPGEADLTVQVDFAAVTEAARCCGFEVDGPITQAELLGRLGVVERASRLMAQNPAKAAGIETSVARLLQPSGMGSRFKAIGLRHGISSALAAF